MLNPHVHPFAPWPGLPPELTARSGQGNWDAYALAAPADRLLPFVFSRPAGPIGTGAAPWVNCAQIVDADTGAVLINLVPTGTNTGTPAPLGLVLDKFPDPANQAEYFIYYGGIIPGLALPCNQTLRLILDNAYQGPRFQALPDLSAYQRLEWNHPGPLSGIPYGTGFTQRLYSLNGGLQFIAPREDRKSTQDSSTGALRTDYLAKYAAATAAVGPIPRYLAEAVAGSEVHAAFTVDGEPWRVTSVKETASGADGGRWLITVALEQLQVLLGRAACPPPPLAPIVYDPVIDASRAWRCGDKTDTAADYQNAGATSCELSNGYRTGYALSTYQDQNPNSSTYGQTQPHRVYDIIACPLPFVYQSVRVQGVTLKNDCPSGYQSASQVYYDLVAGSATSVVSQADADAQAQALYATNAQANANANGTCQLIPVPSAIYSPVYSPNGCFSGYMVNKSDSTDVRGATQAEFNQYGFTQTGADGQVCPVY